MWYSSKAFKEGEASKAGDTCPYEEGSVDFHRWQDGHRTTFAPPVEPVTPKLKPFCSTCGKDVTEILCAGCAKWWGENTPAAPKDADAGEPMEDSAERRGMMKALRRFCEIRYADPEDTPYYVQEGFKAGYSAALAAAEQGRESAVWVPVSERLPEKEGEYWVTYERCEGSPMVDNLRYTGSLGWYASDVRVTAWMPYVEPAPYTEEAKDAE